MHVHVLVHMYMYNVFVYTVEPVPLCKCKIYGGYLLYPGHTIPCQNGCLPIMSYLFLCCRELLERYSQCKTSVEVIAAQEQWLEAERKAVKDSSIDYPPSCSSSSDEDGDGEEMEGEEVESGRGERDGSAARLCNNGPASSGSVQRYMKVYL